MVKRITKEGTVYHEPPYTAQEQLEIANFTNGGVVQFSRLSPRPKKACSDRK